MNKKSYYLIVSLTFLAVFIWKVSETEEQPVDFTGRVKISLRGVGHQLLLSNQDSTSLVLPVYELENFKYELSFEDQLSFQPNVLVDLVKKSLEKAELSMQYRVEVIQCADQEVAYSYEMKNAKEKNIIPCAGRLLPKNCYLIQIQFTDKKANFVKALAIYILFILVFAFLLYLLFKKKNMSNKESISSSEPKIEDNYFSLGSFRFYPEQNKLVKETIEISLSKKECEILAIFLENPNQIIKREELSKRVWEDQGVIVGRSLDTYISKLRKKLKEDSSIKLTNVHGVGYKLEIS